MKKLVVALLACLALCRLGAAEGQWLTDLANAKATAKAENKTVLVLFTGSDWCPPCMALHKTVFSSKEFKDYAKDNLVLVEVDFPNDKTKQSKQLQASNQALKKGFKVGGYPTVVFLNPDGKEIKRNEGYSPGSAKDYVADLQKLKK